VATMLIAGGAKLDEADSRGWRPLHVAAWGCRSDMVELLLQKGVTADAKTVDGHTALGLGFREYGYGNGDAVARRRIYDILSMAIARQKKSMFRQLTNSFGSSATESKTAAQRNLAWHTAQLAEALYQPGSVAMGEEAESDEVSLDADGSEIGVAVSGDDFSPVVQDELYDAPSGSSKR
jgi:hypothetical protein